MGEWMRIETCPDHTTVLFWDNGIHVPTWPVDLWAKLRWLASVSRRPIKEEALIAIEEHLKANDLLTDKEIEELRKARENDVQ